LQGLGERGGALKADLERLAWVATAAAQPIPPTQPTKTDRRPKR